MTYKKAKTSAFYNTIILKFLTADVIKLKGVMNYWSAVFGEFFGTAVLILLGNGVNASVNYKKMFANQSGKWIVIAFGWGFAVFCGAITAGAMGGLAHLNPALSLQIAIQNSQIVDGFYNSVKEALNVNYLAAVWINFLLQIILQILGAMFGQVVLNFLNWKFIQNPENDLKTIRSTHCTGAVYPQAYLHNFAYEFVATLVLIGLILAFGKLGITQNVFQYFPVTFLVVAIGISLGSATGYAINPARDFGPRLVYFLIIKNLKQDLKHVEWKYSWIPIIAPKAAGLILGFISWI